MKTLLILRHAKSSWKEKGLPDHERPLNKRGREDAPRVGRLLAKADLLPDLILASTARRARETVDRLLGEVAYRGDLFYRRDLYAAEVEALISVLQSVDDRYQRVLLVGHNPGLEELLTRLAGVAEHLATASLAQVELPVESWEEVGQGDETSGKVICLWSPKDL